MISVAENDIVKQAQKNLACFNIKTKQNKKSYGSYLKMERHHRGFGDLIDKYDQKLRCYIGDS